MQIVRQKLGRWWSVVVVKALDGNMGWWVTKSLDFRCLLWVVVPSYFRPSVLSAIASLDFYSQSNLRILTLLT